jgi:hypothetical protein
MAAREAIPAERRIGLLAEVDPAAAFAQISAWSAELMAANVREAQ